MASSNRRTLKKIRLPLLAVTLLVLILVWRQMNLPPQVSLHSSPNATLVTPTDIPSSEAVPNTSQLAKAYFRYLENQQTSKVTVIPSQPLPTPTPTPLSLKSMDERYGPCVQVPVLMYHHIENLDVAKSQGYAGLTVVPSNLKHHLEYLRTQGYQTITTDQLTDFFTNRTELPPRPIILTFDDGYQDFYTQAYPLLTQYQTPGVLFVSTGLVENPGYLTWTQLNEMVASGWVTTGNHTWSHLNIGSAASKVEWEISTAQTQLQDHQLKPARIFAYPYGVTSPHGIRYLANQGFQLAFTTRNGKIACAQQKLEIPRIRIGNASLSTYGL